MMALPNNLITGVTAKLPGIPGDWKKQAAQSRATRMATARADAMLRRESYRISIEPVSVRLPFPPSLNHYYRRAVVAGHAASYISKRGKIYRDAVVTQWQRDVRVTFEGNLAIKVAAVFPDRRKYDLDGLWKALLDSLEHAGAYADDSQITAESMESVGVEKPGWVDIILGPRPGQRQGTLFETQW